MRFKNKLYSLSLLLVATLATAQDQEQKQGNSANPFSGLNDLLKGVTNSLNGTINQVNSATADVRVEKLQMTQEQVSAPEKTINATTVERTRPAQSATQDSSPLLGTTALNGIFAKYPYDGTAKNHYPKVAITVTDWTSSDCWHAHAKIWWSQKKSERASTFKVCWRDSLSRAADNAVNYQLFMRQTTFDGSGNVRTEGPKAPMMAYPMPDPFGVSNYAKGQQAISFIQQVLTETSWQPGAPTNIWVVKYDASSASPAVTAPPISVTALDTFRKCDVAAMPKPPIRLSNGFKIIKVQPDMFGDGNNKGMKIVFNKRIERIDRYLKETTGYDFTSTDLPKSGQISFDRDETGEEENYLICYRQR